MDIGDQDQVKEGRESGWAKGKKRFSELLWDRRVWISADLHQVAADVPRLGRAFQRRKDNEHVVIPFTNVDGGTKEKSSHGNIFCNDLIASESRLAWLGAFLAQ